MEEEVKGVEGFNYSSQDGQLWNNKKKILAPFTTLFTIMAM